MFYVVYRNMRTVNSSHFNIYSINLTLNTISSVYLPELPYIFFGRLNKRVTLPAYAASACMYIMKILMFKLLFLRGYFPVR